MTIENINTINKIKPFVWVLGIFVVILMYKSQEILYVRNISEFLIIVVSGGIIISSPLILRKKNIKITKKQLIGIFLIICLFFYEIFIVSTTAILSIIINLIFILAGITIFLFQDDIKINLLRIFNFFTKWMILISIISFLFLLLGYGLPNYIDDSDPYYTHIIYPFFNLNYTEEDIIPRFASTFLEPGHFATMCVFLLYLGNFNLRKWDNIVYLIGTLISWSLAGYGLLLIAYGLYLIQRKKIGIIIIVGVLFFLLGIFSYNYNDGDNPFYEYIYSRLEIEDGDIKGNNRTSSYFDSEYEKYLNSPQMLFGKGKEAFGNENNSGFNITIGTAGYKRYFFIRGIIGSFLILVFIILYYTQYKSKECLGFLIVFIVANIIRDYPLKPIWLYIYIFSLPYLYQYKINHTIIPKINN